MRCRRLPAHRALTPRGRGPRESPTPQVHLAPDGSINRLSLRTRPRWRNPCHCASTTPPPNFTAKTTQGTIDFHEWIGDSWAVLFSHPKDFTPVCTTELGYMAKIEPEFTKRNTKLIGLSSTRSRTTSKWAKDIEETQGAKREVPDDRRHRPRGRQALQHAARRGGRHVRGPHRRRPTRPCARCSSSARTRRSS